MGWNPHKIIGIVLIGLALLQPLLGIAGKFVCFFKKKNKMHSWNFFVFCLWILANRMYIVNRFETPIFPDKVHWWLGNTSYVVANYSRHHWQQMDTGRLLLLLGSGNSFLGLVLLAATEPIIRSSTMVFFGCVVLIVIFFLCGQFL